MTTTNIINTTINYIEINKHFDIVKITNLNPKKGMYYISDYKYSKALSVAYEYNGANMYILYEKGDFDRDIFEKEVKFTCYKAEQVDAKTISEHMIIKLFLNKLCNNVDSNSRFNNLSGSLFIYDINKMKTNSLGAFEINIKKDKPSSHIVINISATTFIKYKQKELQGKITKKKRFVFSDVEGRYLKEAEPEDEYVFIQGKFGSKKSTSKFYELNTTEDSSNRVSLLYKTINMFNKYNDKFVELNLTDIKSINPHIKGETKKIEDIIFEKVREHSVNVINLTNENCNDFINTLKMLFNGVNIIENPIKNQLNIVIVHEKPFYENKDDPYSSIDKTLLTQCVTIENMDKYKCETNESTGEIKLSAPLSVVIKELYIKYDILVNKSVTLDNWLERPGMCFYDFGQLIKNKDNKKEYVYTLSIDPSGNLLFDCVEAESYKYIDKLRDSNADMIVISPQGVINTITKTDIIALPKEEVMNIKSKAKDIITEYYDGVFGINEYFLDNIHYYSIGMNYKNYKFDIPKATHLYKVESFGKENIINEIVSFCSISFVKYNDFTVIPYPFKYLREYIEIYTKNN